MCAVGKGTEQICLPMPVRGRKLRAEPWRSPESRSFILVMRQSQLLIFKQYWALGKFRCRPEIHGLAKDCCYCHVSDLLKNNINSKLNVPCWQWWHICVKEEIFQRRKISLTVCYDCPVGVLQKGRCWGAFSCGEALIALSGGVVSPH